MENMEQAKAKMLELEGRLRERGVVDIKFHKSAEFYKLSDLEKARDICTVLEAILNGEAKPVEFPYLNDGCMHQMHGSPKMPSPVVRCGGGHYGENNHEEGKPSGTAAS